MQGRTILLAEDDASIRLVLTQAMASEGWKVRATPSLSALARWISEGEGDIVVSDVYLGDENLFEFLPQMRRHRPELPFIVVSAQNNVLTATTALENGAFDYLPKPFDLDQLLQAIARGLRPVENRLQGPQRRQAELDAQLPMIGRSSAMQDVYRLMARVMNADFPVLIEGEVGTGKHLVSRSLHNLSNRRAAPLIRVNLAWDVPTNIDKHRRELSDGSSAFYDFVRAQIENARHGTLVLQGVEELPWHRQAILTDLLRDGDHATDLMGKPNDVAFSRSARILVETSGDLPKMVQNGAFRAELYYQINVATIHVPALRYRREDIPDLARAFLVRRASPNGEERQFAPEALDALSRYSWPGNVQELENIVRRLSALSSDRRISADQVDALIGDQGIANHEPDGPENMDTLLDRLVGQLWLGFQRKASRSSAAKDAEGLYDYVLKAFERPLFRQIIDHTGGNKVRAAEILGINRNTLRMRSVKLGLEKTNIAG